MDSQVLKPTIIRIKRRRDEEPHDALLVESKKKRSRPSDLFEFVETVEEHEITNNPQYGKDLIARAGTGFKEPSSPSTSTHSMKSPQNHTAPHKSPTKRYTVLKPVAQNVTIEEDKSSTKPTTEGLAMYDAVIDTRARRKRKEDPAMSEIIDGISGLGKETTNTDDNTDDKFVVDVYLQRPMPADYRMPESVGLLSRSSLLNAEMVDSDPGSDSPSDDDDENSNSEDFYRNDYPDEDPDEDSDHSFADYDNEYSEEEEEEEEDDEEERAELRDLLRSRGIVMPE